MKEEILRIDNGMVSVRGNTVLSSIYLQVFAGETLGIVFNNMEERDALIRLLQGEEKLVHGRFHLLEELLRGNLSGRLVKKNIFIIRETSLLLSTLSIPENIYFTRFHSFFIDSIHYRRKAQELFQEYGVDIPAGKPVKQLTNLERVTVELLKATALGCRMVVIANIIGLLNNTEQEVFLQLVTRLKQCGMAFIVIESFQDILFEHTDNLLIIRDGRTTGMFPSRQADRNRIYRHLLQNPSSPAPENAEKGKTLFNAEEVVLKLENVSGELLRNVSFELRKGEILKILYTDNAPADHLIRLLKGTESPADGRIFVGGKPYRSSGVRDSQEKGICFVEENPAERMLFKHLSVMYNVCMPLADKVDWFWFRKNYGRSVMKTLENLIPPGYFKKRVSDLPLNMLQKIVYCKWLIYSPDIVVCIKPFSVTDIQVNQVTEQMIKLLAGKGIAVLLLSSNWPSVSTIVGDTLFLENGELVNKL
jgi:ABC-type sugar transport system ATPase subunit